MTEKEEKGDRYNIDIVERVPSVRFSLKTECEAKIPREIRIFHQGGRQREVRRGIAKNENSGLGPFGPA